MDADTTMSPAQEPEGDEHGVYASLNSLSIDGQPPEVGDKVSVTVDGTIHSIDGDTACITPETVNGEPAPTPANKVEPTSDSLRADLEQNAQSGY